MKNPEEEATTTTSDEQNNEEEDDESFFDSLERIPSLLSLNLNHSSSSSSSNKESFRISFSSALEDNDITPAAAAAAAFDYNIWLADPVPLTERRRRLLHEMGLATTKDGSFPPHSPPPAAGLLRSFSSPPSPWLFAAKTEGGSGEESAGGCKITNLDTGKEFMVSGVGKEGTCGRLNDVQTGLQLTVEEFERFIGFSPIVNELMRRVNFGGEKKKKKKKKRGNWLKNIKERYQGFSSAVDWLKVHQHGKTLKELTGLYMCQEIQAHQGSIWCLGFSFDGRFLASAGEDRIVRVWRVMENLGLMTSSGMEKDGIRGSYGLKKMRRKRKLGNRKSFWPDCVALPDTVLSISETPFCSFEGHLDDVLDLSWSKSQHLISSSMDKTVRLWDMESRACLKLFAHNDYVTCIQFNPIDDNHFISGSLDGKVRIWSIPKRMVVDWSDLNEMVTAVCYTPDGQGALVGSHNGSFRVYNISDEKLSQESQIDISNKKKKSHAKKITGFQYAPDNPSQVLVTSAGSQIRVFDGVDIIHKFRGFRNTSSQISASFSSDGKYIVCASEDSHVYIWKRGMPRSAGGAGKSKACITARSHEHFYCKDVSVAIPWPNNGGNCEKKPTLPSSSNRSKQSTYSLDDLFRSTDQAFSMRTDSVQASSSRTAFGLNNSSSLRSLCSVNLASSSSSSSFASWGWGGRSNKVATSSLESSNAWGLAVVTAGLGGNIRIYQNFGFPVRLNRQNNLF